jgi:hypothetical protein
VRPIVLFDCGYEKGVVDILTDGERESLCACSGVRNLRPLIQPKQFGDPQMQLKGTAISDSVVR